MKRALAMILALVTACAAVYVPCFADGAEYYNVIWEYSGTAGAGERVSAMVMDIDANINNPTKDELRRIEVVTADENGKFVLRFPLENVQLDESGSIVNMKLNSNIEGLTLSAGKLTDKVKTSVLLTNVYEEDGVPYVPVVSTFEELGIMMKETSDGVYEGFGKNGPIVIEMGKDTAEVDWVDIEMPAASKYVNGVAMVPAYILEDAAYTEPADYNRERKSVRIVTKSGNGLYSNYSDEVDYESILPTLPSGTEVAGASRFLSGLKATTSKSLVELSTVSVEGESFNKAKRIVTKPYSYTEPAESDIQLICTVPYEIKAGEVSLMSFKARALEVEDDGNEASILVMYQRYSDWAKSLAKNITVKKGEWQQFYLPVYSAYNDMPSGSPVTFGVGGKAKTIEIADFSFVTYGTDISPDVFIPTSADGYKGIEDNALWRKEANRRIEKYRKGDVRVNVFDENGNPVQNAEIKVNQTESEFMFGLALMNGELPDTGDNATTNKRITNELIENSVNTLVPSDAMKPPYIHEYDGTESIAMANKIISRGKRMRGHTLMWDLDSEMWPIDNYQNISYEELYRQVAVYVLPTAYAFRGKMEQWDMLNEPVQCNWLRKKYGTRLYSDISREVHRIDPDAKLYINETGIEGLGKKTDSDEAADTLVGIVRRMKAEGAHIDGIGIQAHCGKYLYPQGFFRQLDKCAKEVDEISVTEYDFKNENKDFEAEHLRDTLLATFSHPKAKAFVVWEYWDKQHWNSSAPFYNEDWSEKPAKAVWDKMVNDDFMTRTEAVSDRNGNADFRGFYGDYEITAKVNGSSVTFPFKLRSDGENVINITAADSLTFSVSAKPDNALTEIEYSSVSEAGRELAESKPYEFSGIVLEADFRNASEKQLGSISSDEFLSGDSWGSGTGLSKCVEVNDYGVTALSSGGSCDLRRRKKGRIFDGTDLSFECMFSTFDLREDAAETEFVLDTNGANDLSAGKIVCSADGYYFMTADGERIGLSENSSYNLTVGLKNQGGNKFGIVYNIYCGDELCGEREKAEAVELDPSELAGVIFNQTARGTSGRTAYRLINTRLKYSTADDMVLFSDAGGQKYLLCDSLNGFDASAVTEDSTSEGYLNGDLWLASSPNYNKAFGSHRYEWASKYLWTIRNGSGLTEQTLKKRFNPIKGGGSIRMEFDIFCNAPGQWYNDMGNAGIRLRNADGSAKADVFKYHYNRYHGANFFALNVDSFEGNYTESKNGHYWINNGGVTDLNKNTLNAVFELVPNSGGSYDARLMVKNYVGKTVVDYSASDYISAETVKKLDNIEIFSDMSSASGTDTGNIVCGVKNIVISKTADSVYRDEEGNLVTGSDGRIGIDYENITGRSVEAALTVGAYKDGVLTSVQKKLITVPEIKKGGIGIDVKETGADFYRVFLFKGLDSLTPYNKATRILLNNGNGKNAE